MSAGAVADSGLIGRVSFTCDTGQAQYLTMAGFSLSTTGTGSAALNETVNTITSSFRLANGLTVDISDDAGGAVEDLGVVQSTIRNEASPLTSIPGPGFIGSSFSPISANVSFVDTDVPLSNDNHVLVNVPIKFTVPVDPDAKTIRIELYLEHQTLNI